MAGVAADGYDSTRVAGDIIELGNLMLHVRRRDAARHWSGAQAADAMRRAAASGLRVQ